MTFWSYAFTSYGTAKEFVFGQYSFRFLTDCLKRIRQQELLRIFGGCHCNLYLVYDSLRLNRKKLPGEGVFVWLLN